MKKIIITCIVCLSVCYSALALDFSYTDNATAFCPANTFTFTPDSSASFFWVFGDGGHTTGYQVTRSYPPGIYTVVLRYNYSGASYDSIAKVITVTGMTITGVVTPPTCDYLSNGHIDVTATGMLQPYTYQWSHGPNTEDVSVPHGTYGVAVTDDNGCVFSKSFQINSPPHILASTPFHDADCHGNYGFIRAATTYATPPYTYQWSNGATTETVTVPAGGYSVTITDANGCTVSSSRSIQASQLRMNLYDRNPPCGTTDGLITPLPFGSITPYHYFWSTGDTTPQLTNLGPGTYSVTITDSTGDCSLIDTFNLVSTGVSNMAFTYNVVNASCSGQPVGSIDMSLTGGMAPYYYNWSTGATTQDISGLAPGTYYVTVTDFTGCSKTGQVAIGSGNIAAVFDIDSASCRGNDGTVSVTISNGTPPYSYIWTGAQGNGASASGISVGNFSVSVTDNTGCSQSFTASMPKVTDCTATISGRVFVDMNANCLQDSSELGLSNKYVLVYAGLYAYTDSLGDYTISLPVPDTVQVALPYMHPAPLCPIGQAYTVALHNGTDSSAGNNFAIPLPQRQEVSVTIVTDAARSGFSYAVYATVNNEGGLNAGGLINLTLDEHVFNGAIFNVTPVQVDTPNRTIIWNYRNISPLQSQDFIAYNTVPGPPDLLAGDTLYHSVRIFPSTGDGRAENNVKSTTSIVTGAVDPNDKAVKVNGHNADGIVSVTDTLFEYLIRFQNVGTDTAFNIFIRDTIDEDLDLSTFRLLSSSHHCDFTIGSNRDIEFIFNNILLADSNKSEPLSHGYVQYEIEKDRLAPPLNSIENEAAIYFDFNAPIITNRVVSTPGTIGVGELKQGKDISIYPNPANNEVTIDAHGKTLKQVVITDILGASVLQLYPGSESISFSAADLSEGIYLVRVYSGTDWTSAKLIVIR